MFIVKNNISDNTYKIFNFLRTNAPDANIDTLKQISIYVASSNKNTLDINNDFKLSFDKVNNFYTLRLENKKIMFYNAKDRFGFKILSYDLENKLIMLSDVSLRILGDLTKLNVYSEIISGNLGKFVVTFRPNDMSDNSIKFGTINYYTKEEVDWVYGVVKRDDIYTDFDLIAKANGIYPFSEKCFFDIPLEYENVELDCYDGCLKNYLQRVDLLFDNIKVCVKKEVKTKERKK